MLYLYLSLCILFLGILVVIFIRSVGEDRIPPNAQLLVNAWNSTVGTKFGVVPTEVSDTEMSGNDMEMNIV